MLIEYKANGMKRDVPEGIAKTLIARKLAKAVYLTRDMAAEEVEISERTGKPKRRYRRRDMTAED